MIDRDETNEDAEMRALEHSLREELRRPVPLPEGFSRRVLDRVAAEAETPGRPVSHMRWQAVAAAAAVIAVLGASSGIWEGRQARQQTARQAQQQFLLAMQITDVSLRNAGQRIDTQLAQSVANIHSANPSR